MNAQKLLKSQIFRIVAAGLIWKDNRVLLLQRPENEVFYAGIWELPGGTRDFNESSTDALIREVREEIKLDITVIKPISTFDYVLEKYNGIIDTTQINFLVTVNDPLQKPQVSIEHQAVKWFTLEEIKVLNKITEETRRCILAKSPQGFGKRLEQSI